MPEETPIPRPQIFSDTIVTLLGEDVANKIVDQICQGLAEAPQRQSPTTLCLEIIVFELDKDILRSLVKCTFAQLNPVLIAQEIIRAFRQINHYINGSSKPTDPPEPSPEDAIHATPAPPAQYNLNICKFDLLREVVTKLNCLRTSLLDSCNLRESIFEQILLRPTQLPASELNNLYAVIDHIIIQQFREMLVTQHDNFALKLCNKVSCINSDLEFISDQIKQLTINFPAAEKGIIEIADAAASVAESFFSEEDDFAEIFEAVDAVAEVIEDLAEFYQVKLEQLEDLLNLSTSGCPVPIQARVTLPNIPEAPPPPPIFSVVNVPGPIQLPTPPFLTP